MDNYFLCEREQSHGPCAVFFIVPTEHFASTTITSLQFSLKSILMLHFWSLVFLFLLKVVTNRQSGWNTFAYNWKNIPDEDSTAITQPYRNVPANSNQPSIEREKLNCTRSAMEKYKRHMPPITLGKKIAFPLYLWLYEIPTVSFSFHISTHQQGPSHFRSLFNVSTCLPFWHAIQ